MTAASRSCESVCVGVNVDLSCGAREADGAREAEKALKRALGGVIDIPGINMGSIEQSKGRATEEPREGRARQ
jgi:hypothetical protein